jgi:hypothetical protein
MSIFEHIDPVPLPRLERIPPENSLTLSLPENAGLLLYDSKQDDKEEAEEEQEEEEEKRDRRKFRKTMSEVEDERMSEIYAEEQNEYQIDPGIYERRINQQQETMYHKIHPASINQPLQINIHHHHHHHHHHYHTR